MEDKNILKKEKEKESYQLHVLLTPKHRDHGLFWAHILTSKHACALKHNCAQMDNQLDHLDTPLKQNPHFFSSFFLFYLLKQHSWNLPGHMHHGYFKTP